MFHLIWSPEKVESILGTSGVPEIPESNSIVDYVLLNSIDFFSLGKWATPSQSVGRNTERKMEWPIIDLVSISYF